MVNNLNFCDVKIIFYEYFPNLEIFMIFEVFRAVSYVSIE